MYVLHHTSFTDDYIYAHSHLHVVHACVYISHIPAGQLHLRVEYQCAPLTGPVTVAVNFAELTV